MNSNIERINDPLYLPDWLFITGITKEAEFIKNRTVLIHKPTYSVLELFPNERNPAFYKGPSYRFRYTNEKGIHKRYLFLLYCTLSDDIYLIFRMATSWYCDYLEWKEKHEERLQQN